MAENWLSRLKLHKTRLLHLARRFQKLKPSPSPAPQPWQELQTLLSSYHSPASPPDVLLFGDSVTIRKAHEDLDRRTLGQMVMDALAPDHQTCCICGSAYTPRIYHHFLRLLEVCGSHPRLVIIPINLRCFSPQWDWQPLWQFQREIDTLEQFRLDQNRPIPLQPEERPDPAAQALYKNIPVSYPEISFTRIRQFQKVIASKPKTAAGRAYRWKIIFMFHYMHRLKEDHRILLDLQQSLSLLKSLGLKAMVYITPINFQAGVRYVGDTFGGTVNYNLMVIQNLLGPTPIEKACFPLENWAASFESDCFFHDSDPTEHLNERGRKRLAQAIAEAARRTLSQS